MSAEMADDTIDIVGKLIESCRDGQEGYRDAAEHTQTAELKDLFNRQSLQRAKFAGELEGVAQGLGESDPNRGPSMANKLHRAWFDLKQKFGGGDESVLKSVEAGEDNAKKHYEEALQAKLPGDVHTIIERQSQSVFAAHDLVRNLRDRYKNAA
jgi:uncharacterized protein (TIGR02284 family)